MNYLHAKSPCCHTKIIHYGKRRRQCTGCKTTWRIRLKKRGRKLRRIRSNLLERTLEQKFTLVQQSTIGKLSAPVLQKRCRRSLERMNQSSENFKMPAGKLILIIDAIVFIFKEVGVYKKYTAYLMAIRSVDKNRALIIEPVILPGRENLLDWLKVMDTLPETAEKRIIALVSDGFRGIEGLARSKGWLLQRCHFHLIAQLQQFRGKFKKNIPHLKLREAIYQVCMKIIEETDNKKLKRSIFELKIYLADYRCPRWIKMRCNELLRRLNNFRTYINYPELNLPTTTNTIESFNRTIRELANRSRGFRTVKSLRMWLSGLAKIKPYRTCNPKNLPTKYRY